MALIYTTLASDTFNRPNEDPLNPAVWRADPDPLAPPPIAPLQIINNQAVSTDLSEGIGIYYGIDWPNDQSAQVQIDTCNGDGTGDPVAVLLVMRRQNDHNGYAFEVNGPLGPDCNIVVYSEWTAPDSPIIIGTTFFTGDAEGDGINVPLYVGDFIRMEFVGNTIAAYVIHDGVKKQVLAPTAATPELPFGQVAVDLFDNDSFQDAAVSNFSGGGIISTDSTPGGVKIPLPFSLRTTAAVTVFSCLQQCKLALTITTDALTISALQLLQHQLFVTYRILQHQDVANQKEKLDAAIADAEMEIDSLYAVVLAMPAPIPPTDDANVLPRIVAVVANGVRQISNCVVDE